MKKRSGKAYSGRILMPFILTQTSGHSKNDLFSRKNWPSMPCCCCRTFQSFRKELDQVLFPDLCHILGMRSSQHFQDFSKICFKVKIWFIVLRPEKTDPNKNHFAFIVVARGEGAIKMPPMIKKLWQLSLAVFSCIFCFSNYAHNSN